MTDFQLVAQKFKLLTFWGQIFAVLGFLSIAFFHIAENTNLSDLLIFGLTCLIAAIVFGVRAIFSVKMDTVAKEEARRRAETAELLQLRELRTLLSTSTTNLAAFLSATHEEIHYLNGQSPPGATEEGTQRKNDQVRDLEKLLVLLAPRPKT